MASTNESKSGRQARPENVPASGEPVINGTAQVGESLTADTSDMEDGNGLDRVKLRFQWVSHDGSADTDIANATDSTYTLVADDAGKTIKVRVAFTDRGGYSESLTGGETATVAARPNSPATGAPAVTGTAQVGETLTSDTSGIADVDGLTKVSYRYQWVANDATADTDITGATASTYALMADDAGNTIKVRVSFTDDAGNDESLTSAATEAVSFAVQQQVANYPATGAPAITGAAQVGKTLTADTSGIADDDGLDNVSYSYQWLADDADIAGATAATYTLTDADEGAAIKVQVSFTDDAGHEETLTSAATEAVDARPNSPATGQPTQVAPQSGSDPDAYVTVVITSSDDTVSWSDPDECTSDYNTYLSVTSGPGTGTTSRTHIGSVASGSTEATQTISLNWTGNSLDPPRVKAELYCGTFDASSSQNVLIASTYLATHLYLAPQFTGLREGTYSSAPLTALTISSGTLSPTFDRGKNTYTAEVPSDVEVITLDPTVLTGYQTDFVRNPGWGVLRGCGWGCNYSYGNGATTGIVLADADEETEGFQINLNRGENRLGIGVNTGNVSAGPGRLYLLVVTVANSPATGQPTISGTAQVGQTLTAGTSEISDVDGLTNVTYSYQWLADDADIAGATATTYTLADADEGKAIKVRVSFTDDAGFNETLTSSATAAVEAAPNTPATGAPAISGTAQVGETLTAETSGISDADGLASATFAYQWLADDAELASATGGSYVLTTSEMDKTIKVRVSFTDDAGNGETLTSTATSSVAARPNSAATGAPTISGTAHVEETLTAGTSGIGDADGLTNVSYNYQWIANDGTSDTDITGATDSSYILVAADEGKTIKVQVSFTDDAGHEETLTSAATEAVDARPNSPATGQPTQVAPQSGSDPDAYVTVVITSSDDTVSWSDPDECTSDYNTYLSVTSGPGTGTTSRTHIGSVASGSTEATQTISLNWTGNSLDPPRVKAELYCGTFDASSSQNVLIASTYLATHLYLAPQFTGLREGTYSSAPLTALTISSGTLSPTFDRGKNTYTAEVPSDVEVITLDPTVLTGYQTDFVRNPGWGVLRGCGWGCNYSYGNGATTGIVLADADEETEGFQINLNRGENRLGIGVNTGNVSAGPGRLYLLVVTVANSPATGQPTISGTAQVGQTLTAGTSEISDVDGLTNVTYSYQWLADDADIAGATATTYTLADADEGKAIKVRVSFTDDAGFNETLTSSATQAVSFAVQQQVANNPATGAPTISGTAQVGEMLTADTTGIADDDGFDNVSYSYQWVANDGNVDTDIMDATDSAYTLVAPDEGKAIKVKVSFTDDAGNDETLSSGATDAVAAPECDNIGDCDIKDVDDLLLPDLVSYQHEYSVAEVVATPDGTEFFALRFAGFVTNLGDGPLDLRGNPQLADDADLTSHDVWQRALTIDGDWVNLTKPPIDFEVDDGHDHFHVMGIVEYSLWDTSGTVEISSGAKIGFCLIDVMERPDLHANPGPKRHEQWNPDNYYCQSGRPRAKILHMGISEGWQDIYSFSETFQWIDVSDVQPGYYRIGQRADPDNVIVESDETNNELVLTQRLQVVPGYVARPETVSVEPDAAVRFKLSVDEYFDDTNLEYRSPRTRAHRIVTQPSHGSLDVGDTVTVIVDGATHQVFTDEWVTYTPDPGYAGVDSFTFVALDESRPRYPINPVVAKVTILSAGKLGITGFPRIGEVLTATTTGIADADGFENVSFSYQWIRNDGGADADITGATDSNYVLVDADWGSTIKVRVSFTDDAGYAWTLTSEATAQASGPPGVPELPVGTAVFIGGVDLEWDDVIWADSYDVQLFRNGQWTDLPADDVAIAFYGAGAIISGLDPESSLWFRVRAENAHSISDWSEMLYMGSTNESQSGRRAKPDNVPASGAPVISGTAQLGESLTADTTGIEDGNGLDRVQFRFQWVSHDGSADADIASATDSTYTLLASDEGKTIKVRVAFTDRGGYWESLTSAATSSVAARPNSAATGAPTITGTAQVGETLTADTSGIADADGLTNVTYSYQWIANDGTADTDIPDATDSTYTLAAADESRTVKVKVSFTDDAGNGETLTSSATAAVDAALNTPATGAPAISGTAQVGETLTADTSGISDADGLASATFAYQWLADDAELASATGGSYVLTTSEMDKTIKVRVSFTDDAGNEETLTSTATGTVSPAVQPQTANSPATGAPIITGTAEVGEILTASTSGIADDDGLDNVSYSYQWVVNDGTSDTDITDATDSTYTLVDTDEDQTIMVEVSFTDDAGNDETLTSAATATVGAAPNNPATGTLSISGTAEVGETLTADTSGIADADGLSGATFTYQWIANDGSADTDIQDATDSTYTLVADDEGKTVKVRVSFTDDAGNGETLTSTATNSVAARPNSAATGAPTINGTVQVGETLTADTSGIGDADGLNNVSYSYQWVANDGTSDTDISGVTSSTYPLVDADQGKTVKVRVSFTDDAGNEETLASSPSEPVEPAATESSDPDATRAGAIDLGDITTLARARYPTYDINGVDDVVDYFMFTITEPKGVQIGIRQLDADATLTLEHEDGTVIGHKSKPGEEHVAMYPTLLEGAYYVRVEAAEEGFNEYRMAHGVNEPNPDRVAELREKATPSNGATGAPTIGGTAQVSETLTADTSGIADDDGLTNVSYSYQWVANDGGTDADISGETDETYTLVAADVGKTIKLRVSFTDDAGNDESLTSAATDEVGFAVQPQTSNNPATGAPTISGTAQVGQTLTADTSGIADDDGLTNVSYGYQWVANDGGTDADISSETDATYTLVAADVGKTIKVKVSFTDDAENEESLTSAATAAVPAADPPAPPTGLSAVVVSHDTVTLTWDDPQDDSITGYVILRRDREIHLVGTFVTIAGDTGSADTTYTDDTVEPDKQYVYRIKAINEHGKVSEESDWVRGFTPAVPVPEKPTGLSAVVSHDTVTLTWDNPQDDSITGYVILRRDREIHPEGTFVTITGDTGSADTTYTDDTVEPDKQYVHRIKAINEHGLSEMSHWLRTDTPNWATGAPTIGGNAQVGETLTAGISEIADEDGLENAVFGYQWVASNGTTDTNIAAATDSTYDLVAADAGKTIKVRVSFTDDAGNEETLTSTATNTVTYQIQQQISNSPATGGPSVTGTAQVGETLTADTSSISDADGLTNVSYQYQWLRNDGNSDSEIAGATDSTYALTDDDEGNTVKVRVSFTDDAGTDESLTSPATATVAARISSPATGVPSVTGTAQVGRTLTADTSGIADDDGLTNVSYSYQWVRTEINDSEHVRPEGSDYGWVLRLISEDIEIAGATNSTYTLVAADGRYSPKNTIKVRVSFTDDKGNEETLTSTSIEVSEKAITISQPYEPPQNEDSPVEHAHIFPLVGSGYGPDGRTWELEFAVGPLVPDDDATTKDYIINYRIVDENGDPLPNCEGDGLGGSLHFMTVSDQVGGNQHSGEVGLSCRGAYFALIEVLDANSNFIDRIVINVS